MSHPSSTFWTCHACRMDVHGDADRCGYCTTPKPKTGRLTGPSLHPQNMPTELDRRIAVTHGAQLGRTMSTLRAIAGLDAADLRECQHDPPCGAEWCSACELVRLDTRLRDIDAVATALLKHHKKRGGRIPQSKLKKIGYIARGEVKT